MKPIDVQIETGTLQEPQSVRPHRRRRMLLFGIAALAVAFVGTVLWYAFATPGGRPSFRAEYYEKFGGPMSPRLDARPIVDEVGEQIYAAYNEVITDSFDRERVRMEFIFDPNASDPLGETDRLRNLTNEFVDRLCATDFPATVDQFAQADGYRRPPPPGRLIDWVGPDLGRVRFIARINRIRMYRAANKADWAEFSRAYESSLALSRLLSTRGTMTETLLGCAVRLISDDELRCALMEHDLGESVLSGLEQARARQRVREFSAKHGLEGERIITLDTLDALHTLGGTLLLSELTKLGGQKDFFGIPVRHVHWVNIAGLLFPSKSESAALVNQLFDCYAAIDEPAFKRSDEAELCSNDDAMTGNMVVDLLAPPFSKYVSAVDVNRTYAAGIDVMLRLAHFHASHGEFPAALSELAGADVTDPLTGKAFGYIRVDQASDPFHRPYLLYSFGRDRVDDGGNAQKTRAKDFRLFDSDFETGFDALISRARAER